MAAEHRCCIKCNADAPDKARGVTLGKPASRLQPGGDQRLLPDNSITLIRLQQKKFRSLWPIVRPVTGGTYVFLTCAIPPLDLRV
jgi:hypothetical protein